jgi:hypothetical protein
MLLEKFLMCTLRISTMHKYTLPFLQEFKTVFRESNEI